MSLVRDALRCWPMLLCMACDDGRPSAPPPSRVEAIASKASSTSSAELCDAVLSREAAPTLTMPEVEGGSARIEGPAWINVWATWCPPCVQELPVVRRIEAALAESGPKLNVRLLSVDSSAEAVAKFQDEHPEARGSLRVRDENSLEPWLATLGLDRGATLPIHVFVHGDGKVACVRTGAVRDSDQRAIRALLSSP